MIQIPRNIEMTLSQFSNRTNLKVESYSGGATKIPFLAGAGIGIREKNPHYSPDIIVGISSGAATALMLALGKEEELRDIVLHLQLSTFFSHSPVNKEGKLTISSPIRGLLTGSLGRMDNLKKLIEETISEKEFNMYKYDEFKPSVLIGITTLNRSNDFRLVDLKSVSYDDMINIIVASASIPIYTNPIKIQNELFYDGGLMYHNAGRLLLENLGNKITSYISVYSRPEEDNTIDEKFNGTSMTRTLSKVIEQLQMVISYNDAVVEQKLQKLHSIKLFEQVYSEKIMKGLYDVNSERLLQLYELGLERVKHISI